MQEQTGLKFVFDMDGIVLIDEIETHLHIELQRTILRFLTTLFPNIQFIITTHSPFVLNSLDNVAIYDLEHFTLVENGLTDLSYTGIVEGYFNTENLSVEISNKFNRYKKLVIKDYLTDADYAELARLEDDLDEIPDFLEIGITCEYERLKLEFQKKEEG